MSLYDYERSRGLARQDVPFYALIMAAYRKADSRNTVLIEAAWPEIAREFRQRYDAPGGRLPTELEVKP